MKASDLLVKCLENEGVEFIYGIPGEENLDFLNSLKDSKIELILTRHEQGAGFMASAFGRLTGKVGVALSTLGPGATNFMTTASYAQLCGIPVLFITGQKPIKKSKQGRFQIVDVVEMMKPTTKFTRQIVDGNNIPSVVRECFRKATQGKPGAVHIELPEDIAAEEVDRKPFPNQENPISEPSLLSVKIAADKVMEAKSPLLLIASGASRCVHIRKALKNLIDKTGIYFCSTQMGKGVLDEREENFLGTAALSDHDYLHCAIDKADLIINVGHDVVEKPPFIMKEEGKKVIHISLFPAVVDDVYFPQFEVVGDLRNSIEVLTNFLASSNNWNFSYFKSAKQEIESHIEEKSQDQGFPLIPQRFVADVRSGVKSNGILSLDNGMYKIWFARNYKAYEPNTILLDNALATMGGGLPVAIGAKIVHPDRDVVAICGDGGFMMNSQELETAVRLKLNLVVVVLMDNAYGMIKWKQAGEGFEDFGLDFGNPDFVVYAESYGAKGHRVSQAGEFSSLLRKCLDSKGVHLIEVPVDYSENEKVLIEELKSKTCNISSF